MVRGNVALTTYKIHSRCHKPYVWSQIEFRKYAKEPHALTKSIGSSAHNNIDNNQQQQRVTNGEKRLSEANGFFDGRTKKNENGMRFNMENQKKRNTTTTSNSNWSSK